MGGGNVLWHIEGASDWSGSSAWRPDVGIDKSVITDPPTNPDGSYK